VVQAAFEQDPLRALTALLGPFRASQVVKMRRAACQVGSPVPIAELVAGVRAADAALPPVAMGNATRELVRFGTRRAFLPEADARACAKVSLAHGDPEAVLRSVAPVPLLEHVPPLYGALALRLQLLECLS
jgi:hypothetical protein